MNHILDIKRAIEQLRDGDARSYLGQALREIHQLKETNELNKGPVVDLLELYDHLMTFQEKRTAWDPNPACSHVHIVVGDSFAGSMKLALQSLGWSTHKLVVMKDNYAIGPLGGLDLPEGREKRRDWFLANITDAFEFELHAPYEEQYSDLLNKLEQIPKQAEVVIWTSRSVREQVGLRLAMHLLRKQPNVIRVCNASVICEKLFNRPDASTEYQRSGEIPPEKLKEALTRTVDSGKLSTAEVTQLAEEWLSVSAQGGVLRIYQEGTVMDVPADYFDAYLLEKLDKLRPPRKASEYVRSARLIGEALGYCEQDIGDTYFEHRSRELIYAGVLEIKGVPAGMRYYSIRRKK